MRFIGENSLANQSSKYLTKVCSKYLFMSTELEVLFLKMGQSCLFYFWSFQTSMQFLVQQINVKNSRSCIWHCDSNSRLLERESPAVTTRPGFSCSVRHLCQASKDLKSSWSYVLADVVYGPMLLHKFCHNISAVKLPQDFDACFEVLCEFWSEYICTWL